MSDANKLKTKLGSGDRAKLEQHLSSLDGINKHLDTVGQLGGDCSLPPALGDIGDIYDEKNHEAVGRLQIDLMVAAMACDITRVSSLQWTVSVGNTTFSQFGLTEGHHELSHHPTDDAVSQAALIKIDNFYAKQMAYLIEKMKSIHEGSGTLLDNTVILWCNELALGNAHSTTTCTTCSPVAAAAPSRPAATSTTRATPTTTSSSPSARRWTWT